MEISATFTKNNVSRLRRLPILGRNAVWRKAKQMKEELLDNIDLMVPTARLVDTSREEPLNEFLKNRVSLVREAPNVWKVGVFTEDIIEYRIILLHEFGGKIKITEPMRKWWILEFGFPLPSNTNYITINELSIFRNTLERVPLDPIDDLRRAL